MRRLDGRVIVAGLVAIGVVFVILNLVFGNGPKGVREFHDPRSAPASRGVTYPIELLEPCAAAVDFDGSFWVPPNGVRPLHQPSEPATVELRGSDRAILRTKSGQRIPLQRYDPPLSLTSCTAS